MRGDAGRGMRGGGNEGRAVGRGQWEEGRGERRIGAGGAGAGQISFCIAWRPAPFEELADLRLAARNDRQAEGRVLGGVQHLDLTRRHLRVAERKSEARNYALRRAALQRDVRLPWLLVVP